MNYGFLSATQEGIPTWKIGSDFRAPHHAHAWVWFNFSNFELQRWVGVLLLQIASVVCHKPKSTVLRSIIIIIWTIFIIIMVSIFLTILFKSLWIASFEIWKLSPFLPLLGWVFAGGTVVKLLSSEPFEISFRRLSVAIILAAIGIILLGNSQSLRHPSLILLWVVTLIAMRGLDYFFSGFQLNKRVFRIFTISMALICIIYMVDGIKDSNLFGTGHRIENINLLKWVRDKTPVTSNFLIPFNFQEFRIGSMRSIVVDFKAVPHDSRSIKKWYTRIADISGLPEPQTMEEAKYNYNLLSTPKLMELREKYGIDFVVINAKKHIGNLSGLQLIYNDLSFRMYKLEP